MIGSELNDKVSTYSGSNSGFYRCLVSRQEASQSRRAFSQARKTQLVPDAWKYDKEGAEIVIFSF